MNTGVLINQKRVSKKINKNLSLKELTQEILKKHLKKGDVIISISLDGTPTSLDDSLKNISIAEYKEINFTIKSNIQLVFEALDSCNLYIDSCIKKVLELSTSYQENNPEKSNQIFEETVELINLLVDLLSKIQSNLKICFKDKFQKSPTIHQLEMDLLSILKAVIPNKEKNNIIMLCDLLEYELVDNLKQWKIKGIPELNKYQKM